MRSGNDAQRGGWLPKNLSDFVQDGLNGDSGLYAVLLLMLMDRIPFHACHEPLSLFCLIFPDGGVDTSRAAFLWPACPGVACEDAQFCMPSMTLPLSGL